ncbi:MAG: hypothetical protein WCT49_01880 [Candidatus Paceibacterota bacterium]|jgi:hypothetical protein|nr:hypothetical protein [Candidatus Paceibacterota bacterium]
MKKLNSWKELQKGRVYNQIYIGRNADYAKINGKETFKVLDTKPELRLYVLYGQFGWPTKDDLRSTKIPVPNPDMYFEDFELFEPADESEWFKKSMKFSSVATALQEGLLKAEDICNIEIARSVFSPFYDAKSRSGGIWLYFPVEGRTVLPLLQTVYIVWKNWDEVRADLEKHGTTINWYK